MSAALASDSDADADFAHPFPYRILTLLAGDAGAITYLAQTTGGVPRHVALKIVRPWRDPAAVAARFERWKAALVECRHPGLTTLLDAGTLGPDSVYLATEYVAGSALEPLLRSAALDREQRGEIARQLAAAMRVVHDRGLAHMRLELSRIKIAVEPDIRATVLGLGTALVLDGTPADPEIDRAALQKIARELGVAAPPPE